MEDIQCEVRRMDYGNCRLCPRQCGVDRTKGELGFCKMPGRVRAARAAAHYWEEPVISGSFGSGAVFFSGCTLGCGFCQNSEISSGGFGKELNTDQLREVFLRLIEDGVENINLVTPTHFLPDILPALEPKLPVPVVYNCGGYERVETLRMLEGKVDIWLPDMKYSLPALAARLSGAADYVETAKAAICEMVRQVGPPVIQDGIMERGVIIRHLVLPGNVENSLGVLDWISETFRPGEVLVSLMSQYTPMGKLRNTPPFDRTVTEDEYAAVRSWMDLCGIREGFCQDPQAIGKEYIPDFDLKGLIPEKTNNKCLKFI